MLFHGSQQCNFSIVFKSLSVERDPEIIINGQTDQNLFLAIAIKYRTMQRITYYQKADELRNSVNSFDF